MKWKRHFNQLYCRGKKRQQRNKMKKKWGKPQQLWSAETFRRDYNEAVERGEDPDSSQNPATGRRLNFKRRDRNVSRPRSADELAGLIFNRNQQHTSQVLAVRAWRPPLPVTSCNFLSVYHKPLPFPFFTFTLCAFHCGVHAASSLTF